MFDVIYIEKSLQKKESREALNELFWVREFLESSPNRKIEYVENVQKLNASTLLIGETKTFLDIGRELHAPVLAVLNESEDLFAFPYAVTALSDITLEYLELIQCRYEKRPYKVLETERLIVMEMDEAAAIEYFSLKQEEPEYFAPQSVEMVAEDVTETALAYIKNVYPFYGYGIWSVYEKESGCRVGFAGVEKLTEELEEISKQESFMNLSYYIKPEYRRRGYAMECCQAIVAYAKGELQEEKVRCVIAKENLPSRLLAEQLDVGVTVCP